MERLFLVDVAHYHEDNNGRDNYIDDGMDSVSLDDWVLLR